MGPLEIVHSLGELIWDQIALDVPQLSLGVWPGIQATLQRYSGTCIHEHSYCRGNPRYRDTGHHCKVYRQLGLQIYAQGHEDIDRGDT